jgi:hypothetical protein
LMANINLLKWRARKLAPKYIGPFKVTKILPEMLNYELELSPELMAQLLWISQKLEI